MRPTWLVGPDDDEHGDDDGDGHDDDGDHDSEHDGEHDGEHDDDEDGEDGGSMAQGDGSITQESIQRLAGYQQPHVSPAEAFVQLGNTE